MWAAQKALYHDFLCKIVGIPEGPIDIHRYWPIRVLKPSAWPWAQASELNRLLPNLVDMRRLEVKFCSSKRWYLRCGPSSLSWTWRVIDLNFFQSFSIHQNSISSISDILIIPPSLGPVSGQLNMLWDVEAMLLETSHWTFPGFMLSLGGIPWGETPAIATLTCWVRLSLS